MADRTIVVREVIEKERVVYRDRPIPPRRGPPPPRKATWKECGLIFLITLANFFGTWLMLVAACYVGSRDNVWLLAIAPAFFGVCCFGAGCGGIFYTLQGLLGFLSKDWI